MGVSSGQEGVGKKERVESSRPGRAAPANRPVYPTIVRDGHQNASGFRSTDGVEQAVSRRRAEDRGEPMVLTILIDDATSRIEAGFYEGETVLSHFDLLGRWLQKHGRPLGLYTDRDSIFEAHSKGRPDYPSARWASRRSRSATVNRRLNSGCSR